MLQIMTPEEVLKKYKIRITPFRVSVLKAFLNADQAISMNDIEDYLGEHDRVTLYRTIKSFTEKGVIHEITMPGNIRKLALGSFSNEVHEHQDHQHVHFQCVSCNEVFCIDVEDSPQITIKGFEIEEVEIQAKGKCIACIKNLN